MSEDGQNQQQAVKPKTITGKLLALPFAAFGIVCGSLILSIIVELVGMSFFWPEEGWHHARDMFYYEVEQLDATFTKSLILSNPVQTTEWMLAHVYDWLFINSGLLEKMNTTPVEQQTMAVQGQRMSFKAYLGQAVSGVQAYLLAAAYTTLTVLVRVVILILSLPLILLTVFVGFVDGLVRRDLRRFTAGRESGFVYHRARSFIAPILTLPWVIYLALPISISPLFVMLPCAALAGIVMDVATASFKKYL